jgi:hypothetical protein
MLYGKIFPSRGPFFHPDQHIQLGNTLAAYTIGSLHANVQVKCLVEVISELFVSDGLGSYFQYKAMKNVLAIAVVLITVLLAQRYQFMWSHQLPGFCAMKADSHWR